MKTPVKSQRSQLEILPVIIDGTTVTTTSSSTGVTEGSPEVTAEKHDSTAGLYTIDIVTPFGRKPAVTANALHATATLVCTLVTVTASQIVIQVDNDSGTATAATELHVHIAGSPKAI